MREHKIRIWNGEELLGPFDLTQNPKYWADKLQDGEITHYITRKDMNGVEIYEGDVVELIDEEEPFLVKFDEENVAFILHNTFKYDFWNFDEYKTHEIKIIGNIYENKGLVLEEK